MLGATDLRWLPLPEEVDVTWKLLYFIGSIAYALTVLALLGVISVAATAFFVVMVFSLCAGAIIRNVPPKEH